MNNDEQTFVKFDKALATGGVAGGVATGEKPSCQGRVMAYTFRCLVSRIDAWTLLFSVWMVVQTRWCRRCAFHTDIELLQG